MKLEFLGAGGAGTVPRFGCHCPACDEAREKGAPYTRYGPSIFIRDLSLLIDTPEEIAIQLNRAQVERVDAVTYSHWHPDHTAGMRVWENNIDPQRTWSSPFETRCTQVYLPEIVARTFDDWHALTDKLAYLENLKVIETQTIPDGASFTLKTTKITPFTLAEVYACGFLFEDHQQRTLICMDELHNWIPPAWLGQLDLAILPAGLFDLHPLTGQRVIPVDHPLLKSEATFTQTLAMVRQLQVKRVVFMHLNELDGLTFDQYRELAARLNSDPSLNLPAIEFAYDTMQVEVGTSNNVSPNPRRFKDI